MERISHPKVWRGGDIFMATTCRMEFKKLMYIYWSVTTHSYTWHTSAHNGQGGGWKPILPPSPPPPPPPFDIWVLPPLVMVLHKICIRPKGDSRLIYRALMALYTLVCNQTQGEPHRRVYMCYDQHRVIIVTLARTWNASHHTCDDMCDSELK